MLSCKLYYNRGEGSFDLNYCMNTRIMSKRKKTAILSISFMAVLLLSFVSYWGVAKSRVDAFTSLEHTCLGQDGNYIRLGDADIHYMRKGDGDTSILLIHGFGGGTFSYRYNMEVLAQHYTVYALDLKGFGYSQRPVGSDYSHQSQAGIVLAFLEKMEINTITAAGHSMGGAVLLLAYQMQPAMFERLVLIDSAGLNEDASLLSSFVIQPVVDIIYDRVVVREDQFKQILSSAYYEPSFVDEKHLSIYRKPLMIKNSNRALREMVSDRQPYDLENILSDIDIPVLIVWGKQDTWIDLEHAYIFDRLIDGSRLVVLDRCGHLPMEEQSGQFNEALLDFMR